MERDRIGPYLVGAELGSGGMGRVYRAEVVGRAPGLDQGSPVALKIIHPHLLEKAGFYERFMREAEIGKSVRHPNVVRCLGCDAVDHGGVRVNYLVMEYVEGQTLRTLLAELERVPEELCRTLARDVARGLAAIHAAGVVHRDLKPENVLITPDHAVKVMDLGVARLMDETIHLSQTGGFIGTIEYAAPEQFRSGDAGIDGRADLYALGVMLYELSTARHPYRDTDARKVLRRVLEETPPKVGELNPQLSPFFEEVVAKLIARNREERFASAMDLVGILIEGERSAWWKAREHEIRTQTKRPPRRIRIPRETALYGRDEDLTRLRRIFDRAKAGEGQVLLLEGEAGIGKTRLVDEFVGRLRSAGEDVSFLFGSHPPGGAATAAGAWSTAYREHFGAEGLEERLRDYLTVTPTLIPAFAALLKGGPPPAGTEPLTKDSVQTAFVHATRALAAERPTIVLIEDLHFAPEEGRALFASIAQAVPEHRILLIGTARPGLPEAWKANIERLEQASWLALARLGPKDLTKLLVDAFRSEPLAEELSYRIAAKSDGNPFFVFEIIRGLREGQFITRKPDGSWITSKRIVQIHVPSSVLDLVKARVSDLTEEERDLLDLASCCGFEFDPLLVAEAAGLAALPVLKRLSQIERHHRLVRAAGSEYVFDHHQVQEALYGSLSEPLRQAYHAAIGEALEDRGSDDAVAMCEHHLKGGRPERAMPRLDAALTRLEQGYANDRAVELADRALSTPRLLGGTRRAEILLRKAERLDLLGRPGPERAALDEALAIAENEGAPPMRARIRRQLGHHLIRTGHNDEAVESLVLARELAVSAGETGVAIEAMAGLGHICRVQGRTEEARAHYERCLSLAREIGDRRNEAAALGNLGHVLRDRGRYREALDHCERALGVAREAGCRSIEVLVTGILGVTILFQGRYERAAGLFERQLVLAREIGDRRGEFNAMGNLGAAFDAGGRDQGARQQLERQISLAREMGDRRGEAVSLGVMALHLMNRGRYEEAREHYERSLSITREIGYRGGEVADLIGLGLISSCLGRLEEAREHYERSLSISREHGYRREEAQATCNLGLVSIDQGRFGEARDLLERGMALLEEMGDRPQVGEVLAIVGMLLSRVGDQEAARERLMTALEISREVGDRAGRSTALQELGLVAEEQEDPAGAERLYREALEEERFLDRPKSLAGILLSLGGLLGRVGRPAEARACLTEAIDAVRALEVPGLQVLLASHRAALADAGTEEAEAARRALVSSEERLRVSERMEARFLLWKAAGDPADLEEAKKLLQHLERHAPPEYRECMLRRVRLHREIAFARLPT